MTNPHRGLVIASRGVTAEPGAAAVEVTIFAPVPSAGGGFRCGYRIVRGSSTRDIDIAGEDALQALVAALRVAASELAGASGTEGDFIHRYFGDLLDLTF